MSTSRVFLSYASDDWSWVNNFRDARWFNVGNAKVVDYKHGDNLPFGELNKWLEEEIEGAAVVICFLTDSYITKKYTQIEWNLARRRLAKRKLIFVPILLHPAAKDWWYQKKAAGDLSDLSGDYQYCDLMVNQKPPVIVSGRDGSISDEATRQISQIAYLIREKLEAKALVDISTGTRAGAIEKPVGSVVVLGHPTAVLPPELLENLNALESALAERSLAPVRWPNQWRDPANAPAQSPADDASFYIQPVSKFEAEISANDLGATRENLLEINASLTPSERVVLWAPSAALDSKFVSAQQGRRTDDDPALRTDAAAALADWLLHEVRAARGENELVIQFEEWTDEGTEIDRESAALRSILRSTFSEAVSAVVVPAPETWPFAEQSLFVDQINSVPDRSIVVVHDLNLKPMPDMRQARKEMETKFALMQDCVRNALLERPRKLDLFWAALIIRNSRNLPFAVWPKPGRFEDWSVLRFNRVASGAGALPAGAIAVTPDPGTLNIFRVRLRDWLAAGPSTAS